MGAAEHNRWVIDDDPQFCELVTTILTGTGFGVLPALEGPSGIELAPVAQSMVILLDMVMPGANGIATCKEPKRDRVLGDIPVVGMAGSSNLMGAPQTFDAERGGDARNTNPVIGGLFPDLPFELRGVSFTTKCPTESLPPCHLGQPLLGILFQNRGSIAPKSAEISSPYSLRREFWHDSWTPGSGRSRAREGRGAFESLFQNLRCQEILPW